jgi:hypothetical protein
MRGDCAAIVVAISLAAAAAVAQPFPAGNAQALAQRSNELPIPSRPFTGESVAPPSVTIIDPADAQGILGREVRSAADENMGRIVDVVVDRSGQVRAAVIDFGGFLGVGSRKIAVDWKALHFARIANEGDRIILDLTRDQVKEAPEYKDGKPVVVLGVSGSFDPLRIDPPTSSEK